MKNVRLFLFALVLACASLVSCGPSTSTPSGMVSAALEMAVSNDYAGYFGYFVNAEGEPLSDEEVEKLETFAAAAMEDENADPIVSFEVLEEEISEDGKTATVKYSSVTKSGKEDSETIDLMNVDGKWRMVMDLGF